MRYKKNLIDFYMKCGDQMINLNRFRHKLKTFPRSYMRDFDGFWEWKVRCEGRGESILDNRNVEMTYDRLCSILPRWQTYRGGGNSEPLNTLRNALREIREAYAQIREYSLLDFSEIPIEPLRLIWHGLGRVKECGGRRNPHGFYYIISICKPLMLLWGQTLAFDSRVRGNLPSRFHAPKEARWCFEDWRRVMVRIQECLRENPDVVGFFRWLSEVRYGAGYAIPYGRFLDIYYF